MRGALGLAALIERTRPERARDGLRDPFHERLALEGGAGPAPVHPALVAAALGHGRHAGVALERARGREALALLSEGDQEARGEDGPCARRRTEKNNGGFRGF